MSTLSTALWAAVGALAIATAAVWANRQRRANLVFGASSGLLSGWFILVHAAITLPSVGALRFAWASLLWWPVLLWMLRRIASADSATGWAAISQAKGWCAVAAVTSGIVFTRWFHTGAEAAEGQYGPGLGLKWIAAVAVAVLAAFGITSYRVMRRHVGAARLEIQLLALGGVLAGFSAVALLVCVTLAPGGPWSRLLPLVVLALWGGTVWSLLTTRLLDARHILTIGCEKAALVAFVSAFVWGIQQLGEQFIPGWLAFGIGIALGLWLAAELRPLLQQVSQRKAHAERLRKAAVEIARKDLRPEAMEDAFCKLVREWAHCDKAVILMASHGRLTGQGLEWPLDDPAIRLLHAMRWVSPERLQRERRRSSGDELHELLRREGFSAIVASAGPALNFALAVGTPRHHRPFIFPEIGQLLGLQSIIESSLARAHYLTKVQHAEQLATVGLLGASIAHEIRNPLVSIKTFVQLLPRHYQDAAFRDKFFRLIGDEVGRIDRLTEQLLDLSAPRVFAAQRLALHPLLLNCVDLIAAKAEDKGVRIDTDFLAQPDEVFTDPNAVKQVVLNLGFNAIQALEQHAGDRVIQLSTRYISDAVEVTVSDTGPGIAEEVWARLFQPFQTTKSSGFGLGLAICKDILSSLHASISADPPRPGSGATFRIVLPCQPPTS
jgi:signal transduction histidine kinase